MAILKIARMGHPVLRGRAEPVKDPAEPWVARLIEDMLETVADADGAGLAAPQVHVPLRLVIFSAGEGPPMVLMNPEIAVLDGAVETAFEGCLSVPGLVGAVPRHASIRYRGMGRGGEIIDQVATGFHARVVQHECDHLDGVLYPMRMPDLSLLGFAEEMQKAMQGKG
jgi:peptide deformylase